MSLKQYLPNIYDSNYEMNELVKAEDPSFDEARMILNQEFDNQFVVTCNENGIRRYEAFMKITPNPATESLEFRKQRVMNRLSMHPPYTMAFLRWKLDQIIGEGKYVLSRDIQTFTLYIESSAKNQQWYEEVHVTINKVKPANMVFINVPLTVSRISLMEEVSATRDDWNYRAGTTAKASETTPVGSNKNLGVIKLPEVKSLTLEFAEAVAEDIQDIVTRVVVNDVYEPQFTTVVDSNRNIIEYDVPEMALTDAAITDVKFYNANNSVMSNDVIYVPITGSIHLKHVIYVDL